MSTKTLAEIADEVASEQGEEYASLDVQETFDAWLIEAAVELLGEGDWPFLRTEQNITLIADQAPYLLVAGTGEVLSVREPDSDDTLTFATKDQLIDDEVDLEETGTPEVWYLSGLSGDQRYLSVWPVPSAVDTLICRYVIEMSNLTRTSLLPLPNDCIPALKHMMRKLYKENVEDFNGADRSKLAYAEAVFRLRKRYMAPTAMRNTFRASDVSPSTAITHIRYPFA